MSEDLLNQTDNTFLDIDVKVQKETVRQTQLEELDDYLRMLADMDKIGIRRKIVLLEGYLHKVKKIING